MGLRDLKMREIRFRIKGWKAHPKKVKDLYPKSFIPLEESQVTQDTNIRCESGRTICQA